MSASAKLRLGDASLVGAEPKSDHGGWETSRWDEVCEKIQDGTHFSPVTDPSGEFKYLTSKNIRFGYLDLRNVEFIDEPQHRAIYKRCSVRQGDVLLTKDGANTGNAAVNSLVEEFSLLSSVALIRPDPRRLSPDFLLQTILSEQGQRMIKDAMSGLAITRITLEIIKAFSIASPPLTEQTKIAEILSTVDRAIEQTYALIAKQQRLKTGLMQDLLTRGIDEHGRVRSEETHEFKDSPLGRIPVEWEVTPAKELCDAVIDCKNRTPPAASEGHPVIRTPNVRGGEFVYRDLAWTDADAYNLWVSRGKPRPGDVVITREAPFGEACQIPLDMPAACLGQRMMMYQTNAEKLRPDFLVLAIHSEAVQTRLLELAGGSTVGHIRVGDIRSLPIPHPVSVEEQEKISQTLSGAGVALKDLGAQKCKLTSLKTALMQDLLSGQRRVTSLLNGKEGKQ